MRYDTPTIYAVILNSALFIAAVFFAGIWFDREIAWKLAIFDFGLCYITPTLALLGGEKSGLAVTILFVVSIAIGAIAFLSLLI